MKNFNFQTVEVLTNAELAAVKGGAGYGTPTPIVIPEGPAEDAVSNVSAFSALAMSTTSSLHHGGLRHKR